MQHTSEGYHVWSHAQQLPWLPYQIDESAQPHTGMEQTAGSDGRDRLYNADANLGDWNSNLLETIPPGYSAPLLQDWDSEFSALGDMGYGIPRYATPAPAPPRELAATTPPGQSVHSPGNVSRKRGQASHEHAPLQKRPRTDSLNVAQPNVAQVASASAAPPQSRVSDGHGMSPRAIGKLLVYAAKRFGKPPKYETMQLDNGFTFCYNNFEDLGEYVDSCDRLETPEREVEVQPVSHGSDSSDLAQRYRYYQGTRKKVPDSQHGLYHCISGHGCRWCHDNKTTWQKHEQLHYPSDIWVCPNQLCHQLEEHKWIFFRKDLLIRHFGTQHRHKDPPADLKKHRIAIVDSKFPKYCVFEACKETFRSMRERLAHSGRHLKSGHKIDPAKLRTNKAPDHPSMIVENGESETESESESESEAGSTHDGHSDSDFDDGGSAGKEPSSTSRGGPAGGKKSSRGLPGSSHSRSGANESQHRTSSGTSGAKERAASAIVETSAPKERARDASSPWAFHASFIYSVSHALAQMGATIPDSSHRELILNSSNQLRSSFTECQRLVRTGEAGKPGQMLRPVKPTESATSIEMQTNWSPIWRIAHGTCEKPVDPSFLSRLLVHQRNYLVKLGTNLSALLWISLDSVQPLRLDMHLHYVCDIVFEAKTIVQSRGFTPEEAALQANLVETRTAGKEAGTRPISTQRYRITSIVSGNGSAAAAYARKGASLWTPQEDCFLYHLRRKWLSWDAVANRLGGKKTANACRKRHRRLLATTQSALEHGNRSMVRLPDGWWDERCPYLQQVSDMGELFDPCATPLGGTLSAASLATLPDYQPDSRQTSSAPSSTMLLAKTSRLAMNAMDLDRPNELGSYRSEDAPLPRLTPEHQAVEAGKLWTGGQQRMTEEIMVPLLAGPVRFVSRRSMFGLEF